MSRRLLAALAFFTLLTAESRVSGAPRQDITTLKRDLLTQSSATAVLTSWCRAKRLADPPKILALRQREVDKPADAEVRRRLQADPGERIVYRRVDLVCGRHILSRADNWYRPQLLTPDMNRRLETTDAPFGEVVAPLHFHRQALDVRALEGRDVLRLSARLLTPGETPFALVRETYSDEILGAGP
jgi:chorismate-pyruvate lyase